MTGFLEEAPGVRSMTRLAVAVMLVGCIALILSMPVIALKIPDHAAGIIGAEAGALATLAGGIWGALRERA